MWEPNTVQQTRVPRDRYHIQIQLEATVQKQFHCCAKESKREVGGFEAKFLEYSHPLGN